MFHGVPSFAFVLKFFQEAELLEVLLCFECAKLPRHQQSAWGVSVHLDSLQVMTSGKWVFMEPLSEFCMYLYGESLNDHSVIIPHRCNMSGVYFKYNNHLWKWRVGNYFLVPLSAGINCSCLAIFAVFSAGGFAHLSWVAYESKSF